MPRTSPACSNGTGWKGTDTRAYGITLFQKAPEKPGDRRARGARHARQDPQATAETQAGPGARRSQPRVRRRGRPATADAINFMGEPRIQGGPGSTVRPAFRPKAMPTRNALASDGKGARIAVLDTGMFDHEWLRNVRARAVRERRLGRRGRRLRRQRVRPRHVHRRPDPAGRPVRVGLRRQGARLARRRRRPQGRRGDGAAPGRTSTSSTSRSAATRTATSRRWRSPPRCSRTAFNARVVVAAAGNHAEKRPFWPAAFGPVVSVGAVEDKEGLWAPASYSNHGAWVDLVARGTQPAVDVRARDDEGRPGPRRRRQDRPVGHLRRLGRVGRHLVRDADRRRDDRPHDDAHRHLLRARRRRQARPVVRERRAGRRSRTRKLVDELR